MTEIAIPNAEVVSFEDLISGATVIDSPVLEKDKLRLCGFPHVITKVSYRPGVMNKATGIRQDYVSVEAVAAPQSYIDEALKRNWILEEVRDILPNAGERIVYNDGSTGIKRQLTHILWAKQLLKLGIEPQAMSDFDAPYSTWESYEQAAEMNDADGGKFTIPEFSTDKDGRPLAIFPHHGLRASYMDEFETNVFYLS